MLVFIRNEKSTLKPGDIIHIREEKHPEELPHAIFFRPSADKLELLEVGIRRDHHRSLLIHTDHHKWDADMIATTLGINNHRLKVIPSDDEKLHAYSVVPMEN